MERDDGAIYTDGRGRPLERPEPPADDASSEERMAYVRAVWAWKDAKSDLANEAFADAFAVAVKD